MCTLVIGRPCPVIGEQLIRVMWSILEVVVRCSDWILLLHSFAWEARGQDRMVAREPLNTCTAQAPGLVLQSPLQNQAVNKFLETYWWGWRCCSSLVLTWTFCSLLKLRCILQSMVCGGWVSRRFLVSCPLAFFTGKSNLESVRGDISAHLFPKKSLKKFSKVYKTR